MGKIELNAIVMQRVEITPELIILRIVPDGWNLADFEPGQFTVLGLPSSAKRCLLSEPEGISYPEEKLIRRAYSIASSSLSYEYLEFYISIVRSGALTPRLFNLQRGDRLWMSPKFSGMLTLDELPPKADVILIATGTGLAPYMSMVRSKLMSNEINKMAVLHGARNSWDLGYRSELITLQNLVDRFLYVPIISEPENEITPWGGEIGMLHDLWYKNLVGKAWNKDINPSDTHIYLCGNPLMIDAMSDLLTKEGFSIHTKRSPGQIHIEKF